MVEGGIMMDINIKNKNANIKLDKGEGVIIGINTELSMSIIRDGDRLLITGPFNACSESFALEDTGFTKKP